MAGDMMSVMNLNERAWTIADDLAARADELRLAVQTLPSGARVIDAGIDVRGGYGAGIALAELCMGGLGHIRYAQLQIGGTTMPGVEVWTDHPAVACMASQYAGWALSVGKYFAMASGPLRAHARVEKELFDKLDYAETAARGVLVLEGRTIPTEEAVRTRRAEGVALARRSSPSRSRPPRVSPAACRSSRACSKPDCTRWRRSASTCGAS